MGHLRGGGEGASERRGGGDRRGGRKEEPRGHSLGAVGHERREYRDEDKGAPGCCHAEGGRLGGGHGREGRGESDRGDGRGGRGRPPLGRRVLEERAARGLVRGAGCGSGVRTLLLCAAGGKGTTREGKGRESSSADSRKGLVEVHALMLRDGVLADRACASGECAFRGLTCLRGATRRRARGSEALGRRSLSRLLE